MPRSGGNDLVAKARRRRRRYVFLSHAVQMVDVASRGIESFRAAMCAREARRCDEDLVEPCERQAGVCSQASGPGVTN